jgi:lipopolysaccharide transport system permease protein
VDALVALLILGVLIIWFGGSAGVALLALPAFVVLAVAAAFAASLWLAAVNVQFRDVRFVMPFLVQFWLFVTPVAYPSSLIAPQWRAWYALNPMATVVDGFRWTLLGAPPPPAMALLVSSAIVIILVAGGLRYFRKTQGLFADVI